MDATQFAVPQAGFGGAAGTMGYPPYATQGYWGGMTGPGLQPSGVDPITTAYLQHAQLAQQHAQLAQQLAQQAQQVQLARQQAPFGQQLGSFAPQGIFGNVPGQIGQPFGGAIGGMFGPTSLGWQSGGGVGQLGRQSPYGIDPFTAAYLQQTHVAQQHAQLAQQAQQQAQQLAQLAQQEAALAQQQAQPAQQIGFVGPQATYGGGLGQTGQPIGSGIGGLGQPGLSAQFGGGAGQLGRF